MDSRKLTRTPILPGDQIASIEEFEAGKNTYVSDGTVRSIAVGTRNYDFNKRLAKIDKINAPMLPKIGDIIVGYIEMLFGSMMSVRILYIDEKESISGFSAIASARISGRDRDRRSRIIFRTGDIIRGRIISLLNSSIHITIPARRHSSNNATKNSRGAVTKPPSPCTSSTMNDEILSPCSRIITRNAFCEFSIEAGSCRS